MAVRIAFIFTAVGPFELEWLGLESGKGAVQRVEAGQKGGGQSKEPIRGACVHLPINVQHTRPSARPK